MILAYFYPINDTHTLPEKDIATLHEIAFYSAKRGLTCPDEITRNRPDWESWIVASAKRRTLLTTYLFTTIYSTSAMSDSVSNELADVLAPDSESLWQASDRASWEAEYDRHLAKWQDGMVVIGEFWQSPKAGSKKTSERIKRWVTMADEFGMTLFAVTSHRHGCSWAR
jgi:hypothetical protein